MYLSYRNTEGNTKQRRQSPHATIEGTRIEKVICTLDINSKEQRYIETILKYKKRGIYYVEVVL